MARRGPTPRCAVWGLAVCLLGASGCSRLREWSWRTSGVPPDSRRDAGVREELAEFNKRHEQIFANRGGLIDPSQLP
jgi:hypothetical protein